MVSWILAGTTGKISGRVVDAETSESLPGANIVIDAIWMDGIEVDMATKQGAAADPDGYFVILNVSPGVYTLKAAMIGYSSYKITNVRVEIDRTTPANFKMRVQAIEGEAIVVNAERDIIKKDLASSQMNINTSQINDLPVASINAVIGLQAGVEGLSIRGGGTDEVSYMMDGIALRDERTNRPVTGLALSSVQEILMQSGGFSAEYGDLQAGVINVVTREGDINRYSATITMRYSPAGAKHFGSSMFDKNSYFMKPYLDDAVCWTGTNNGAWDEFTQSQFSQFNGWNAYSEQTLKNDNPNDDLTPAAAQRLFLWQHRRDGNITKGDYDMDMGFGGPVPMISKQLGNLRFFASFRNENNMYLIPLAQDNYNDWSGTIKLTSDITTSMKLTFSSFLKRTSAVSSSRSGGGEIFYSTTDIAGVLDAGDAQKESRVFMPDYYCPTDISTTMYSLKLTHVLSPATFYDAFLEFSETKYKTGPGEVRDTATKYQIFPGYKVDEQPYGWDTGLSSGLGGSYFYISGFGDSRDSSKTYTVKGRIDLTNQFNRFNQVKTGLEMIYYGYNMNYGEDMIALPSGQRWVKWNQYPIQANLYVQDKLEFEGWIATIGLRGEYLNPNGEWYDVALYEKNFYSSDYKSFLETPKKKMKSHFTLLPRLGISHPITINSKLYFNYGHQRQKFSPQRLYGIQRNVLGVLEYIGDPDLPLEKTIQYELGYDHALFNMYQLHLAGYYKDKTEQSYTTNFISADNKVDYYKYTSNWYQDIRGFELELRKSVGRWVTGFVNYTYAISSEGYFGYRYYYQDPSAQRIYEKNIGDLEQSKPKARPRVILNTAFHTPEKFGPQVFGQYLMDRIDLTFTGSWKAGSYTTWTGGSSVPGISNNVQWKDYTNFDLKFTKIFRVKNVNMVFFVDVSNLFNFKQFTSYGFVDGNDNLAYWNSLQFPASSDYSNIPGNDRPGDYRKSNVAYVPMKRIESLVGFVPTNASIIYYENKTGRWMKYVEVGDKKEWVEQDSGSINKILDDKAYIDNPNNMSLTFLNPRDIFFGCRLTFDLK